ncbi:MAG: hypothetical protein COB13_001645 [OCS116 cluster bacterium]|nr:hypothetical protein [OCS116 cluster bacterium]
MKIALLHTAQIHVDTFTNLAAEYDVELLHIVQPELLAQARAEGLDSVRIATIAALDGLVDADAVICSCSTLGPIADECAKNNKHILRIDRPLMQAALEYAPNIAVAICLDSTRHATLDLLQDCAHQAGLNINPQVILCDAAWPHFETGNQAEFAQTIAAQIKTEISPTTSCIILAQASMRVAEPLLQSLNLPILSAPKLAIDAAIKIAQHKMKD